MAPTCWMLKMAYPHAQAVMLLQAYVEWYSGRGATLLLHMDSSANHGVLAKFKRKDAQEATQMTTNGTQTGNDKAETFR